MPIQPQPQPEWMTPHFRSAMSPPTQPSAFPIGTEQSDSVELPSAGRVEKLLVSPVPDKKNAVEARKKTDYGNASRWVTAYKLGFSLLVAGAANAFLFGVPLWWAAGLSALVASAQSAIALKIHREDTPFSKKVVAITRKMMQRQQDKTPAGKEWSMVPVWGVACGAMALFEAGFNHLYSKWNPVPHGKDPMELHLARIEESINRDDRFKPLYRLQKRGVELTRDVKKWFRDSFPNHLPAPLKSLNWRMWKKLENVKGNPRAGYLVGVFLAAIGGIAQTAIAAKIQERIDNRQDTNPKALLGALKDSASLKKHRIDASPASSVPSILERGQSPEVPQAKRFFGFDSAAKLPGTINQPNPGALQSRPFGERSMMPSSGKENGLSAQGYFSWQGSAIPAWSQTPS